jgi:D-alanine-D-alanine ligase-like ATP-grasp enzyme
MLVTGDRDRELVLLESRRLIVLHQMEFEPGYWRRMRQPAVLVSILLTRPQVSGSALRRFDTLREAVFPLPLSEGPPPPLDPLVAQHPVLGRVVGFCLDLLSLLRMPVMGGVSGAPAEKGSPRLWRLALPAISADIPAPQEGAILTCGLLNDLADGVDISVAATQAAIERLQGRYRGVAPAGVNTLRFLQAAHERDIPWRHIANNVYQFGWGRYGRWLDSSFTDRTSTISAGLARDKVATAKVLRDAGLPVPRHRLVSTADQAVQAAATFGYPIVLKPADLDGGQGVMVGLRTAEHVRKAFEAAARLSKRVLVEEFIQGSDFRIRVCNGEVHGVVARHPASVTGDGANTIKTLIEQTNEIRRAQPALVDPTAAVGRKPIEIDDEVIAWLQGQGLGLESVVPPGQHVRLRGAANVSLGGTLQELPEAHPDNIQLAIAAASALRLDVAGIDVLLPDISRSFKETGGGICEVNAQPQFSMGMSCHDVLERLVPGQGRIPVVLLHGRLNPPSDRELEAQVVGALRDRGRNVRWSETQEECRQAMLNTTVDAIVWVPRLALSLGEGLPFDRIDLGVDLGSGAASPAPPWANRARACWTLDGAADEVSALPDRLIAWLSEVMELPVQP